MFINYLANFFVKAKGVSYYTYTVQLVGHVGSRWKEMRVYQGNFFGESDPGISPVLLY